MTYLGYMALANDEGETLELVNAARVKAYTDNLAPSIGLRGCDDCEGLPAALGEEYTTPTEDFAPWYDPTDPSTADFYGVYPLGFEGIDDSTRSVESAELSGDGSVVVGSRFTGQDIRVTGMAFAKDEAALYSGISWLNSALNGTEEGRCFGDRLNIFSSCPPVEVLPPDFATPYTLDTGTPNRVNLVTDPRATDTARWTGTGGTGGVVTETAVTGAVDGPVIAGNPAVTTYMRYTFTTGNAGGSPAFNYAHINSDPAFGPFAAAVPFAAAIYVRPSVLVPNAFTFVSQQVNGADGPNVNLSAAALPANVWTRIGGVGAFTVLSDTINSMGVVLNTFNAPLGSTFDVVAAMVTPNQSVLGAYFDGVTTGTGSFLYNWVGGVAGRESVEVPVAAAAAEASEWTTTSGTIVGSGTSVNFAWTAGDPLKVACREITGFIPGEQYQLRFRPETFGNYYVSMGPGCAERYSNLIPGPRFNQNDMSIQGATVVDTRPTTGAPDGGSYFSRLIVAPNTTSPMGLYLSGTNLDGIPVRDDEDYTFTWYAQKLGPLGGPAARLDYTWYDSSGVQISTHNGTGMSPTMTWNRFTQSMGTTPVGAAYVALRVVWTGTAVAGQTLNFAMAMLTPGTTALDYIDGGYPGARWTGAAGNSISTYVENVDAETIFGWGTDHNPPTEPTVLDFVARTETLYLSVQSLGVSNTAPTTFLQIQEALIRRVAHPGVVAFGTGNDAVPPSDGWTHVAPDGMSVTWDLLESAVLTTAQNPVGGSTSYTTATHGPQRTLFGLRPGSRYRLMIEFDASYNATGASATTALAPIVTISNSLASAVTYTNDNVGTFQYFRVVEFTATATSALLAFHPGSNLSIGSQGSVRWQFNEYMVEEILETDTVAPQPGRAQQRTMYEVKAISGATITNIRKAPCGVMAQVTYALRAGNPFKYRNPVFAGGLPTGTSIEVPDIPCSDDGLPQVVNYAYNPSLETNAVDWAGGGTNVTAGRSNLFGGYIGSYSFQATAVAGVGRLNNITAYYIVANVTSGPIPISGEELTVSFYVRTIDLASLGNYSWNIFVTMTGFPAISFSGNVNIAVAETWYRVQQTFTLPSNIALQSIETSVVTPVSLTTGGQLWMDALMIQRGSAATDPFDETFQNVEWSGDPNTSALILTPVAEDISADPDCPAPPAPPAPPEIDNACVIEPSSYNRTVVTIPAETVPRNLSAFPIVTLTAGAQPVRQARIRFWPNPENLTIDTIGPCDYEGEIIVSFLAEGATMVIDGVLREATVSKPGFEDQNGNHVLYGPNGGPVEWPELTGGIPYLVTLELDSDDAYTDTLMTVDLVVRD